MGYCITVTNKAANEAVNRGVAEIHVVKGEPSFACDVDDNPVEEWNNPDQRVLCFKGEDVAIGDGGHYDWGFWAHCSYGGTLGPRLASILAKLEIDYKEEE